MVEYVDALEEMEGIDEGRFGDNPDPVKERYERFIAEKMHLKKMRVNSSTSKGLESSVKLEVDSERKKRKRTILDFQYKGFYEEAINLSRNISLQTEEKSRLLIKYYPRFGDRGVSPIKNADSLKIGSLFNHLLDYSEKRIK